MNWLVITIRRTIVLTRRRPFDRSFSMKLGGNEPESRRSADTARVHDDDYQISKQGSSSIHTHGARVSMWIPWRNDHCWSTQDCCQRFLKFHHVISHLFPIVFSMIKCHWHPVINSYLGHFQTSRLSWESICLPWRRVAAINQLRAGCLSCAEV